MTKAMPFLQKAILLSYDPRRFGGEIFSGRSRGVEVYPRQGKSPLEHQKESLAFRRGILFSVAPGESKFIPVRGNPR